jgi:glutathione S-transferase
MRLYGYKPSLNVFKVRLVLAQLQIPYEYQEVSIFEGESHTEEFLTKNPAGAVPVLEPEPGMYLSESNAILCYLAQGTGLFSDDRWQKAKILQWLFFEQDYIQPTIATLRYWRLTNKTRSPQDIANRMEGAVRVLDSLSRALKDRDFITGTYSIADIALYAYTHRAQEGGIDLTPCPAIQKWIDHVRGTPRYIDDIELYNIDPHAMKEL